MFATFQPTGDLERRCARRQRVLFACIQLDHDNGGLIRDISELGLSVETVAPLIGNELARLRFQLSPSHPAVETRGRIAWTGPSLKTAGLEFIDLPEDARDHIKQWISLGLQANESSRETTLEKSELSRSEAETVIPLFESETVPPVAMSQNRDSIADLEVESPPGIEEDLRGSGTASSSTGSARGTTDPLFSWAELENKVNRKINARKQTSFPKAFAQLVGLTVGLGLLLSGLFYLVRSHLRNSSYGRPYTQVTSSAKSAEPSSETSGSRANSALDVAPSVDRPGLALQVGAMRVKGDADLLAQALQRKNFPAFVPPAETGHLYRVFVGPYKDADAAIRAEEELKEAGFDSFPKPWKAPTEQTPDSGRLR
jgi:hypothetical protein